MSKCILVLSVGRSGSSAVAGMLHALGVDMGREFLGGDRNNPYGTFEDLAFVNLNRAILTDKAESAELANVIRDVSLWGVKDPQLCLTVGHLLPHLYDAGVDVRVVYVSREPEDVIDSYHRAYHSGINVARRWYDTTVDALEKNLARYEGELLELYWSDVLEDPFGTAGKLAQFIGVPNPQLFEATAHIRKPKKREGWGSLALGVRIAKHPEPAFFTSWTSLLTGGVHSGDTVLLPQAHMPAHWAANAIVKDFLMTDKSSLFMVDDDMAFAPDALERLRTNPDTYDNDIVFGFCTHRVWPPKAVVMQLKDPQPEEPELLKGDWFGKAPAFEDGDIIPVDAVGLAFTLIKRHVFEAMINPDYGLEYTWFFDYGRGRESDDISFCRRARELGFTMAVDTNVKIDHVGQTQLGWKDYQIWKAAATGEDVQFDADDLIPILEQVASSENGHHEEAVAILEKINGPAD